jgi:hypothetical protein
MTGEVLTRATVWTAVAGYAIGFCVFTLSRGRRWDSTVRVVWTIACASLFAHFVCAFHFYHHWRHAAAYRETARQTEALFGLNWGGGVFINYGVLVVWIIDVGWWWLRGIESYRARPAILVLAWHAFLIFIIFNGTVIFAHGPARWIGAVVYIVLSLCWVVLIVKK